jgi:GABA permease
VAEHQVLVVANRTLGGEQLLEALRERVRAGADAIWVVAPAAASPRDAGASGFEGDFGWVPSLNLDQPETPDSYQLAEMRLQRVRDQFRALGVPVGGEVGDEDPLRAIGDALAAHPCQEILISTLPRAASHWLRVDLPSRAQRKFHVPVTTVPAPS